MKKPLAILLLLFSFLSAQSDWRKKEVHKLSWSGTDWLNNEKSTFDYSEDDLTVEKLLQFWEEPNWVNRGLDIYEYNFASRLNMHTNWNQWESNAWSRGEREKYYYTPFDEIDYENSYHWNSTHETNPNEWVPLQYTQYYYSENELLDSLSIGVLLDDSNSRTEPSEKEFFTYEDKALVEWVWMRFDRVNDPVWRNASKRLWTYNSEGADSCRTTQSWKDSVWVNAYKWCITYTDSADGGYHREHKLHFWQETYWDTSGTFNWYFDEKRKLILYEHESWNSDRTLLAVDSKKKYEYDTYNNLKTVWYEKKNESEFEVTGKDVYKWESYTASVSDKVSVTMPQTFVLHPAYPNPFNPSTTISYDLPEQAQVTLGIYDLLGKQIKTLVNQSQDAGNKKALWDGTDNLGRSVSAGVYLYQIQAGEFTQTRKMLLLK